MMARFSPGDEVRWFSQAGGYWKEKRGTVVAYLPPGEAASEFVDRSEWSKITGGWTSTIERYLVRVQTGKAAYRYYTPRASVLERV